MTKQFRFEIDMPLVVADQAISLDFRSDLFPTGKVAELIVFALRKCADYIEKRAADAVKVAPAETVVNRVYPAEPTLKEPEVQF